MRLSTLLPLRMWAVAVGVAVPIRTSVFLEGDQKLAAVGELEPLHSNCLRRESRRASVKPAAHSGPVQLDSRFEPVDFLD